MNYQLRSEKNNYLDEGGHVRPESEGKELNDRRGLRQEQGRDHVGARHADQHLGRHDFRQKSLESADAQIERLDFGVFVESRRRRLFDDSGDFFEILEAGRDVRNEQKDIGFALERKKISIFS